MRPTQEQIAAALQSGADMADDNLSINQWFMFLADEVLQLLLKLEHDDKENGESNAQNT